MNIDTIVLKYFSHISKESLQLWDRIEKKRANGGFFNYYCLNTSLENGAEVKCTYHPYTRARKPLLLIEFSVPKVIHGNNYTKVEDIYSTISTLNRVLGTIDGLPPVAIEDGFVHRVDIYYDHQVGDLVPYYIKALQSLEYLYRKTKPWTSEGVQFMNKQKCTKFYNKEKESKDPVNHGILRQEITLRKEAVKKLTGKKYPIIFDLEPYLLKIALDDDLGNLNLLGKSIGTADTTLQMLCQEYGDMAGVYYYGLLHGKVYLTEDIILTSTQSHPRSLDRRLKKIIAVGIPLTLTEYKSPLPPLWIQT